jgi:Tfp pilus assembly protein PilN
MNTVTETLLSWWDSLTASIFSGAEGLGVYLERRELTLVQVQQHFSGINLVNSLRIPIDPDNLEIVLPALRETITAWKVAASPVSLAVSSDFGFFQPGSLPAVASENLAQVVAYELDRFLPLPVSQLYYGFQVIRQTGTDIHFMLLAVPRQRVERCLMLLKEAGLRPMGIELAPVAAAQAFVFQTGKKIPASWLLLHTMADGFELTHIDGPVVRGFCQKRGVQKKDFFKAIQTHLSGMVEAGSGPFTLCVYGEPRPDVANRLIHTYDCNVIYPSEVILPEFSGTRDEGQKLTAFGAAFSCLGKPAFGSNLLPVAEREPVSFPKFSLHNSLMIALLALCLIWAGSALLHTRFLLFQVNRQIARVTPEAREVENLLTEGRALAQQMTSLRALSASPDKLVILKNLTQIIPNNTWLYNVRLSKQILEISGTSQSASELIPLLEKSGWLKKTEFVSPIVTDATKNEHFKIKAEIKSLESAS